MNKYYIYEIGERYKKHKSEEAFVKFLAMSIVFLIAILGLLTIKTK